MTTPSQFADQADQLAANAAGLAAQLHAAAVAAGPVAEAVEPFIFLLAVFLMACFVGYYVV